MAKNKNNDTVTEELATVAAAPLAQVEEEVDFLADDSFSSDAAKVSKDEMVLERLRIVQAMTKDREDLGLREGQLYGNMSKKGIDSAVIVPVHDWKAIIERESTEAGTFVAEYLEVTPHSGNFGDARINAYVKAAGIKDVHKVETDNGNKLGLVYNCLVALLDEETGTQVKGFAVLQADKTNIRPYLLWGQNRVDFDGATKVPTYAFRTKVNGKGVYTNPDGKKTKQYQFEPFLGGNWKASLLTKRSVLEKIREHKELLLGGKIKVADFTTDAESTEASEEAAAF